MKQKKKKLTESVKKTKWSCVLMWQTGTGITIVTYWMLVKHRPQLRFHFKVLGRMEDVVKQDEEDEWKWEMKAEEREDWYWGGF